MAHATTHTLREGSENQQSHNASPACPFYQHPWRSHQVTVKKASEIPPASSLGYFQTVCNRAHYLWEMAVNTYQAIARLGDFEHDRKLLRHSGGQYREVIPFNSMIRETFLITDPSINEGILQHERNGVGEEALFDGGLNVRIVAGITGNHNLMSCPADEHAKLRAFMAPFFEFTALKRYVEKFELQAHQYADRWTGIHSPINVTQEMHRFGLEAISKIFLGMDEHPEVIQNAIDTIGRLGVKHALWRPRLLKALENYFWKEEEQLKSAAQTIDTAVQSVCTKSNNEDNLLSAMRNAKDESSLPLFTKEQIRDNVKLLFLAGQETSASLLVYILYQLALHPEWQNKIRNELTEKNDQSFSDTIMNCKSLQSVFKEGLRLNPPAQVVSRLAQQDTIICSDMGELFVPQGKTLNCDNYFSLRDERRWGQNAENFDPSRFEAEGVDRGPWLPFSTGPDRCIGRHFATLEVKVLLAVVLTRFELTPETLKVKQTGHFTCKIEADHQQSFAGQLLQKLTGSTPSTDVLINFTPLSVKQN